MLPIKGCHNLGAVGFDFTTFSLLNLGLKFVPTPSALPPGGLQSGLLRFCRTVRLRCQFGSGDSAPKFRLPNPAYEPEYAPGPVELLLNSLVSAVHNRQATALRLLAGRIRPNLTMGARQALAALRQRQDIVVKPADKNLGLTVMRVDDYRAAVRSHVLDAQVYTPVLDLAAALHTARFFFFILIGRVGSTHQPAKGHRHPARGRVHPARPAASHRQGTEPWVARRPPPPNF